MLETIYVKYSLPKEITQKVTTLWGGLAEESRKVRRWNVGYGQSLSGKMQYDFLADILRGSGVPAGAIREEVTLPFPGYFQAERRWDLGIFNGERPIALVEFKYYTLEYTLQQGRGSVLVNDLAFKALDLQLAARKAGFDRSGIFVGAFVQIFWRGQPDFRRNLRKTRHPKMYEWAHTKQDAIRKSLNRLVEGRLYDSVVSIQACCPNGKDVNWWSLPEQDLYSFLDRMGATVDGVKFDGGSAPTDGGAKSETGNPKSD